MRRVWNLAVALLLLPVPLLAQGDPSLLTVDRLWGSPEFFDQPFGPARWLADGSGYSTVEPSRAVRGLDIVRYDAQSGARSVLVSAADLVPEGARAPIMVEDYQWSKTGDKLLIFTNTQRVWRDNTRGDYWLLELEGARLRQIGRALVHEATRAGGFRTATNFRPQSRRTLADQAPSCGSGCCTLSPPQLSALSHDAHGAGRR